MSVENDIHTLVLTLAPTARKTRGETPDQRVVRMDTAQRLERSAADVYRQHIASGSNDPKDEVVIFESIKKKLLRFPDGPERLARFNNLLLRLQQNQQSPVDTSQLLELLHELGWTSPTSSSSRPLTSALRDIPRIHTSAKRTRSPPPPTTTGTRSPALGFPRTNATNSPNHMVPGRGSPSYAYSTRHRVSSGRSSASAAAVASVATTFPAPSVSVPPANRTRAWREKSGRPVVPEHELIRDVLFLLGGINGTHVKFEEVVTPTPGSGPKKITQVVFVDDGHHVILEPTRQLIHRITELGRLYKQISTFVDQRSQDPDTGLAMQALCSFIGDELTTYYRLVAVLESQLNDVQVRDATTECDKASTSALTNLTLERVAIWTQDTLLRMRVLSTIVEACKDSKGGALASTIHRYSDNGDPLIKSLTKSLLDQVSRPLFEMLSRWIFEGELQDPFQEFFVKENENYGPDSLSLHTPGVADEGLATYDAASFWQHRFSMREEMRPSFISAQFGRKIFATGKSLNFVRYACGSSDWISSQAFSTRGHALLYSDLEGLERAVDHAHTTVSKHLGEIFLGKLQLVQHLHAMQDYLMLGKGDFVDLLRNQLQEYLDQPSQFLQRHNVAMALESAIRRSSAQNDAADITRRLSAKILDESAGDVGWDVFTLEYKVESPVNTVLDGPAMQKYQIIFGHLWRIKRTEVALSDAWQVVTDARSLFRTLVKRYPRAKSLQSLSEVALLKLSEMNHMVRQMQSFIQLECCAYSWEDLMGSLREQVDLDELIDLHRHYVDGLITKILLRTPSKRDHRDLGNEVRATMQVICSYAELCRQLVSMAQNWSATHVDSATEVEEATQGLETAQVNALGSRLAEQSTRFRERLQTITDGLDRHSNLIVRDLSTRLNFNMYYEVARPHHRKTRDKSTVSK